MILIDADGYDTKSVNYITENVQYFLWTIVSLFSIKFLTSANLLFKFSNVPKAFRLAQVLNHTPFLGTLL